MKKYSQTKGKNGNENEEKNEKMNGKHNKWKINK